MRRESIGTRGVDERGCSGGCELGLWIFGNVGEDKSQRERPVPGPADAREEQVRLVAASAEQQCDQLEGKMLCDVTD